MQFDSEIELVIYNETNKDLDSALKARSEQAGMRQVDLIQIDTFVQ